VVISRGYDGSAMIRDKAGVQDIGFRLVLDCDFERVGFGGAEGGSFHLQSMFNSIPLCLPMPSAEPRA
jgi:hypothetical protein